MKMIKNKKIKILVIIIILILASIFFYKFYNYIYYNKNKITREKFTDKDDSITKTIDYYVITMKTPERLENIKAQESKIKESINTINIEIVDAVVGKDLDLDIYIKHNILQPKNIDSFSQKMNNMKNELGCYLSHMKIYNIIKSKNKKGYSIIFEDDFEVQDDFIEILEKNMNSIKDTDFDYLFLGMLNGEGGAHISENVYDIPKEGDMWQTHAYLIKNENIEKIISNLIPITTLIDVSIFNKGKTNDLIVYTIQPTIANQNQYGTLIRIE